MKKLIFAIFFAPVLVFAQAAPFKGWQAIEKELTTRIGNGPGSLGMEKYIPAPGLEAFLGTWALAGSERAFTNGLPNALNLLIWQMSLSGLGKDIAKSCTRSDSRFNSAFRSVMSDLCKWPAPQGSDPKVLVEYWLAIMGHNAPEDEFLAWRDFFLTSSYKSKPAAESIEAMTLAMMMNPYFLLKR